MDKKGDDLPLFAGIPEIHLPDAGIEPNDLAYVPESLEGVPHADLHAILDAVPVEQTNFLVSILTTKWQTARVLVPKLQTQPWFTKAGFNTASRRLRKLVAAALHRGVRICPDNRGYRIGDWQTLMNSAERCERHAAGSLRKARGLRAMAAAWKKKDGYA